MRSLELATSMRNQRSRAADSSFEPWWVACAAEVSGRSSSGVMDPPPRSRGTPTPVEPSFVRQGRGVLGSDGDRLLRGNTDPPSPPTEAPPPYRVAAGVRCEPGRPARSPTASLGAVPSTMSSPFFTLSPGVTADVSPVGARAEPGRPYDSRSGTLRRVGILKPCLAARCDGPVVCLSQGKTVPWHVGLAGASGEVRSVGGIRG
jgi:hypothetical protein